MTEVKNWIEAHINTRAEHADVLGNLLTDNGAVALTLKDAGSEPIYEPTINRSAPVWPVTTLVGLFDGAENLEPVRLLLEEKKSSGELDDFFFQALPDEDWERKCLDSFQPIHFGHKLWVCPSWQTPPDLDAVNVILDPGLAFGTGTHETTALCLEWLAENLQPNTTVVDYGCGSGILAIAAAKLGAAQVSAVDYDPQALIATRENAARNQIPNNVLDISSVEEYKSVQTVDTVLANILAQPLIQLASTLANLVKSGGNIVLSGVLAEQSVAVGNSYTQWFDMQPIVLKGEWARLVGIKR